MPPAKGNGLGAEIVELDPIGEVEIFIAIAAEVVGYELINSDCRGGKAGAREGREGEKYKEIQQTVQLHKRNDPTTDDFSSGVGPEYTSSNGFVKFIAGSLPQIVR
jgi:hypothetical protein